MKLFELEKAKKVGSGWLWRLRRHRPRPINRVLNSLSERSLRRLETGLQASIFPCFALAAVIGAEPDASWLNIFHEVGLSLLICVPPIATVWYLLILLRSEAKARRDQEAGRIFHDVDAGSASEFALFLRRFQGDTRFVLDHAPIQNLGRQLLTIFDYPSGDPIDRLIIEGFRETTPVVKIGNHEEAEDFGVGTIPFDEGDPAWRRAFEKLANAAKHIVIMPLAQHDSALLDEIVWLHSKKMQTKTLCVMPPEMRVRWKTDSQNQLKRRRASEIWNESAASLENALGVSFPRHHPMGGIVTWDGSKYDLVTAEYGRGWMKRRVMKRAISGSLNHYNRQHAAISVTKRALLGDFSLIAFLVALLSLGHFDPGIDPENPPLPLSLAFVGGIGLWLWNQATRSWSLFSGSRAIGAFSLALLLPPVIFICAFMTGKVIFSVTRQIEFADGSIVVSGLILFVLLRYLIFYWLLPARRQAREIR